MSEINYPSPEKMSAKPGATAENGSFNSGSVIKTPASDSYQNRSAGMQMCEGAGDDVPKGGGQVKFPMEK